MYQWHFRTNRLPDIFKLRRETFEQYLCVYVRDETKQQQKMNARQKMMDNTNTFLSLQISSLGLHYRSNN